MLTDTTIFEFKRKRRGTLVSYGRVSIRSLQDMESAPASTHIRGSVPNPGTKNIITAVGTKRFKERTGSVRLSGAVNMNEFNLNPGEPITFDCLFVIKIDRKSQIVSADNPDEKEAEEDEEKDNKDSDENESETL